MVLFYDFLIPESLIYINKLFYGWSVLVPKNRCNKYPYNDDGSCHGPCTSTNGTLKDYFSLENYKITV